MIDLDAIKKRLATQTNAIFDYEEIAALVAEVEMHRKLRGADCMYINQLCKERDQLKAEVERLKVEAAELHTAWSSSADQLKAENEKLNTQLARTINAAEHALLEMSAWMGIPDKKRAKQIEHYMENVRFCAENDLRHIDKHQAEIERDSALAKLQTCREALDNAQDVLRMLYHTTEGRAAEKAHECARKIDKALEASK